MSYMKALKSSIQQFATFGRSEHHLLISGSTHLITLYVAVAFVISSLLLPDNPAHAAGIYVYKDPDGLVLITNRPQTGTGYTLTKQYSIADSSPTDTSPAKARRARVLTSSYDKLIQEASDINQIDIALVKAVVHAESAFNAGAMSNKGAVGLMQLMPATAAYYGVNDRTDPWQNLLAGSRHLRLLLDRYRDTSLALAAYNAGDEAVKRYNGIPPYPETENYVRKVLHLQTLYRSKG
ncbi:MAG: hypothetical protein DHS20C01_27290 [marine bacterium B5-7]|nr:MAG: hypothetical protein DHS20C01_27290 [marine bacterium B5-7]